MSNALDIKEEMALAPSPAFKSLGYIERMCDECTDDGRKEYISLLEGLVENVTVMHYLDWLTLVLASFVIAFAIFGEVRDTMLCGFSVSEIRREKGVPRVWRFFFKTLTLLRIFVFLPAVMASTYVLILVFGGSAVDICLNSVAVLFLVEVDNLAYYGGLSGKLRHEMELYGRVPVNAEKSRFIDIMQRWFLVSIPIAILVSILLVLSPSSDAFKYSSPEVLPFLLGNVGKSFWKTRDKGRGRIAALGKSLLTDLAGLIVYGSSYAVVVASLVLLYPELS